MDDGRDPLDRVPIEELERALEREREAEAKEPRRGRKPAEKSPG